MNILVTGGAGFIGIMFQVLAEKEIKKLVLVDDLSDGKLKNLKDIKYK